MAEILAEITGFEGAIYYDATKPDGVPRKLMDVSRLTSLGWSAQTDLKTGLRQTYVWFWENRHRRG